MSIGREPKKIYSSANKVFALSKVRPVGVMFFNAADFLGVPWETIIKVYRDELGSKGFDRLEDYFVDFKGFLRSADNLFPSATQQRYLQESLRGYFHVIRERVDEQVKQHLENSQSLLPTDINRIVDQTIDDHYKWWSGFELTADWRPYDAEKFIWEHEQLILDIKDTVFQDHTLSHQSVNRLKELAAMVFSRGQFGNAYSGIVVAGFGERETFPSLRSCFIEGMVDGKLKLRDWEAADISQDSPAALVPFAQSEMVHTFMRGIDPELLDELRKCIKIVLYDYPDIIVSKISGLDDSATESLVGELREVGQQVFSEFLSAIEEMTWDSYVQPVLDAIEALPKDELAAMAESLVNLTSFKRRVTLDAETVGGPIDVAVISKGDGFVWVKRKSYFDPGLNPRLTYRQMTDILNLGGKNNER